MLFLSPLLFYIKNICLCITIPQGLAENICAFCRLLSAYLHLFPPSMCAESSYTNVMQQNSDVSVCPAVIVLSVHILKDIVLNGAACCWLGCMSILNRAFKFLMIIEIISEHPSGTWDCCLGPFYSSRYHIRLIFVCIGK